MYVALSRLKVEQARAPELIAAFCRRARPVDDADGFLDLHVWQSDRDACELVMVSRWRDRAAVTAYMCSDEHRISHERIDPDFDAAIRLEALEHLHTHEVVAE